MGALPAILSVPCADALFWNLVLYRRAEKPGIK
jgi:hypothetical protein